MQARLARSAYDALGIEAGDANPAEVRSAFFELAKTFHPQKFARMSPEIQRLANEVFLSLRAAHDQLARRAPPNRPSGAFNALKTPAPELIRPTVPSRPATSPNVVARPNLPPSPSPAITPGTVRGVPPAGGQTAPRPNAPPAPTTSLGAGTQRGPAVPPTSTQPIQRPNTVPRAPTPSMPIRKVTPPGGVPTTGPRPAVAATPTTAKPATPATQVEPELAGVYDLLQRGQWEAARTTLNALIALQPRPRYRALLAYSHGREAQLSRRIDEARVDLHNALEIDPELQVAKTALAELFTRRK